MRLILAVLAVAGLAVGALAGPVAWPDGKKAAVVLTYDDSLATQIDVALPALDAAGLKGTFFLSGADLEAGDIERWRAAAAEGHELGNHTIFHPCARATEAADTTNTVVERYLSEAYTPDTILDEIRVMNLLLTAIDGKTQHAFATPCGEHLAGGVNYLAALRKSGLTRYVRGVSAPDVSLDPMEVGCEFFSEDATGADLIAVVERAVKSGGMVVLGFHGIGGDYLSIPAASHAELIAYLKAHGDTIWVAPFSTVMDYVTTQQK